MKRVNRQNVQWEKEQRIKSNKMEKRYRIQMTRHILVEKTKQKNTHFFKEAKPKYTIE